jgi:glucose-6-phosphate isomerase
MGESIGKTNDVGIIPTVSVGSTDLHSVGQLYLGGPSVIFTTFVLVEKNKSNLVLPRDHSFDSLVPHLQGKSFAMIMDAIIEGTQHAYRTAKRAYVTIALPEKSAYYMGQFMQLKMMEMVYLGFLLDVNPFDQPAVEQYKKETRRLLAHN